MGDYDIDTIWVADVARSVSNSRRLPYDSDNNWIRKHWVGGLLWGIITRRYGCSCMLS